MGLGQDGLSDFTFVVSRMEEDSQGATRYIVRTVAKCSEHNSTVWRVAWNITGTILASSGDDGVVRLWKGGYWTAFTGILLRGDPFRFFKSVEKN